MPLHVSEPILYAVLWQSCIHGLDPNLILAVIMQESGGDPLIVGDNGHSVGLMQLHDQGAGADMSVADRQDIMLNVARGTSYLADMIVSTGSYPDGLSAYNQGFGGWSANGRAVNQGYVDSVLAIRDRILAEGYEPVSIRKGMRW